MRAKVRVSMAKHKAFSWGVPQESHLAHTRSLLAARHSPDLSMAQLQHDPRVSHGLTADTSSDYCPVGPGRPSVLIE